MIQTSNNEFFQRVLMLMSSHDVEGLLDYIIVEIRRVPEAKGKLIEAVVRIAGEYIGEIGKINGVQ